MIAIYQAYTHPHACTHTHSGGTQPHAPTHTINKSPPLSEGHELHASMLFHKHEPVSKTYRSIINMRISDAAPLSHACICAPIVCTQQDERLTHTTRTLVRTTHTHTCTSCNRRTRNFATGLAVIRHDRPDKTNSGAYN